MGLCGGNIGFFLAPVWGSFRVLCCGNIGTFCSNIGLFGGNVGSFVYLASKENRMYNTRLLAVLWIVLAAVFVSLCESISLFEVLFVAVKAFGGTMISFGGSIYQSL